MAIQDYILNGRPGSELLFVFLRDRTPYVKMGRSLPYQVFNGYRIKMGFFKCPFHGLRRAVGTNMVVAGIPVTTVSQVLGHSGIDPKVLPRVRPYDLRHRFALTVLMKARIFMRCCRIFGPIWGTKSFWTLLTTSTSCRNALWYLLEYNGIISTASE